MRVSLVRNILICAILAFATAAARPARAGVEIYRIRVRNKAGGLVQVSMDGGKSYCTVGRVRRAANSRILGFTAASYTPDGAVAATAVHGIRIKTGQFANGYVEKAQMPLMFSIVPLQFAQIPRGYGGLRPRSSGIETDIYAGHSIFRNESPFVGNPVFLEKNHDLEPLPEDYTPQGGEVFVIEVDAPDDAPREIDFENKAHGDVVAKYAGGKSEVLAEVERPVEGVGRYDGTTFTGVGAVNTNHGGVLTISTAPVCPPSTIEGGARETRGGFMIQPFYHDWKGGDASPQVMVIGPRDKTRPHMEGKPPIFYGCIDLRRFVGSPRHSFRAQVRIDNGAWESVPRIIGKVDDAFTAPYLQKYFAAIGRPRCVKEGVTAIRLLFPKYDARLTAKDLARQTNDYTARALAAGVHPRSGIITLALSRAIIRRNNLSSAQDRAYRMASFYVDGNKAYESNEYPYQFRWDSRSVGNGFHEVEIDITDGSDHPTVTQTYNVLVENK